MLDSLASGLFQAWVSIKAVAVVQEHAVVVYCLYCKKLYCTQYR